MTLLLPVPTPAGLPVMQPFQLDPYSGFGQWVTYDQARRFVSYWNGLVPGMQILPGDDEKTQDAGNFGIYKPFAVETYFPESKAGPDGVFYYWLAARFLSGSGSARQLRGGLDIGLMIAQFFRYPYSSGLVISDLVTQVLSMPAQPYQGA
jgi:hypothetical protein